MSLDPRAVGQEAATWYLSHTDEQRCNSENIRTYLRGVAMAVTSNVLFSDVEDHSAGLELEIQATPEPSKETKFSEDSNVPGIDTGAKRQGREKGGHWSQFLYQESNEDIILVPSHQLDKNIEKFGPRTRARIQAFLAGCVLAVPDDPLSSSTAHTGTKAKTASDNMTEQNGEEPQSSKANTSNGLSLSAALSGFHASTSKTTSSIMNSSRRRLSQQKYPQLCHSNLAVRMELYVRTLQRVRQTGEECVVHLHPARAMRVYSTLLVDAFVNTVGCVRFLSPHLIQLITCWTKEQLAIDTLGDDLKTLIRRVASEYERQISFASLAFLSSPEASAETHLIPLLLSYAQYLRTDWKNMIADSNLERFLSASLDSGLRQMFKTVEFRSIAHLLEVCHEHRHALQNILIPPTGGEWSIHSACADPKIVHQAIRDLRREVITVNGHALPPVQSRTELVRLLTERLNYRSFTTLHQRKANRNAKLASRKCASPIRGAVTKSSNYSTGTISDPDQLFSSGNEGDTDGSYSDSDWKNGGRDTLDITRRKRSFDVNAISFITRRLLVAASRTGIGGDAFFVVRDLFGGEGVEVMPSLHNSRKFRDGVPSVPTMEIAVSLTSVTIKCHGRFDVYAKPVSEDCEPLIQLQTVTSESIALQEVRAKDHHEFEDDDDDEEDDDDERTTLLIMREKETEKSGWKTLSIKPASYEKVQEWNTPS